MSQDIKFRQVKFQLQDNSFRQFFKPSRQRLRRLLLRYQPKNVYTSVSKWIYFKEHGTYANRLLNSDYLAEFDNVELEEVKEAHRFIQEKYGLMLRKNIQSSERGYHLVYETPDMCMEDQINFKNMVTDDIVSGGFGVDEQVSRDIFRVSRLENTLNGNKNFISHCLGTKAGCLPVSRMTKRENLTSPRSEAKDRSEIKTNLPVRYSYNFISNAVNGTKGLYVPLIKWQGLRRKSLKRVISHFNLGSFMAISTPKDFYVLFFRCFDRKGLIKLYNYAKSNSVREFEKYGYNWIPFKGYDGFGIDRAYFHNNACFGWFSRPHVDFFGLDCGGKMCGKGNIRVYKAVRGKNQKRMMNNGRTTD